MQDVETRHVSPLLATAIVGLPIIFAWFLLRPGYATSTRKAGFTWLAANVLVAVIWAVFGE